LPQGDRSQSDEHDDDIRQASTRMTRTAILVNGVPASGKSTVSRRIAAHLALPRLALDTVKEALFAELGTGDRLHNRRFGRASYGAIWALVGEFPADSAVVVDAWFGFQPLELLHSHLDRAGVTRSVEVWCAAPPEVIAQRYADRTRERSEGHLGLDYVPELRELAARARPLAIGPVVSVDTSLPVDWEDVIDRVRGLAAL
jgi:glucokinase